MQHKELLLILLIGGVVLGATYYTTAKQVEGAKVESVKPVESFEESRNPPTINNTPLPPQSTIPPQGQEFKNTHFKNGYLMPIGATVLAVGGASAAGIGTYVYLSRHSNNKYSIFKNISPLSDVFVPSTGYYIFQKWKQYTVNN